jgi:DDE superfamily endonuclease
MEDVLDVYTRPYDPCRPQVCLDETSRQLVAETRAPLPMAPGQPARHDPEYVRAGVVNLFVVGEPLRGWRQVRVSAQRTRIDWAHCVRDLVDVHYPEAETIVLVMDQLNTHSPAALYEAFPRARPSGSPTSWSCITRPSMGAGSTWRRLSWVSFSGNAWTDAWPTARR